jgi:divalent metal cation (Fe/Co/Zn/Cd) transporter
MIARLKLWAVAAGLVIAALATSWLGGRKAAQTDIKVKGLEDAVDAHEVRNEVENRVARERDARQRLRDDWSR